MWKYLKDNPILTAIMAVCLVIIIVVLAITISKNNKAKKAQTAAPAPSKTSPPTTSSTEPTEPTEPVQTTETVAPVQSAQADPTAQATETKEEETKEEEIKDAEINDESPKEQDEDKPTKTKAAKTKPEKNKNRENMDMNLKDLKNVQPETTDFYDDDDENDKIARYSGKWVICRVVTANSKSADVIQAGENDDEMYFFELRASNGEKLLTSEEYTTYNGALNGIATHKSNIEKGNFKITLSKKGDYLFKLLSGKNMLLCLGEHYATKARCESAIESTKRFAKTAIIDENVQDIVITPPAEDDSDADIKLPETGYDGKWIIRSNTAKDGEQVYYFELFASNGERLLSSEEYTTYIGAINGIGTHKANIEKGNFRVSLTKRGDYIYKLLNGNGQLLCLGEHYKTKRRCLNAVESVKRFAKNAPILSDQDTVNKNA